MNRHIMAGQGRMSEIQDPGTIGAVPTSSRLPYNITAGYNPAIDLATATCNHRLQFSSYSNRKKLAKGPSGGPDAPAKLNRADRSGGH
jgi:hypothetical protein